MPLVAPSPSPVWTAGAAPPGVRRAMAADGLLVEVLADVWLPTDLVHDPAARAAALAVHLSGAPGVRRPGRWRPPAGAVVARAAAAWVHGCPSPPRQVDLLVPHGTGPCGAGGVARLRRVTDPSRGACSLGGLAVTGRERTTADLRASADPGDAEALRWAQGLPVRGLGRPGQAPAGSSRRPVAR